MTEIPPPNYVRVAELRLRLLLRGAGCYAQRARTPFPDLLVYQRRVKIGLHKKNRVKRLDALAGSAA